MLAFILAADTNIFWFIGGAVLIIGGLIFTAMAWSVISLYIQATSSGCSIGIMYLILMKFRNVNPRLIVLAYIQATKAQLPDTTVNKLESHYLSGGDVISVVNALIAAQNASIRLDYRTACSIDLAGRDVFDAVKMSVLPKVIDCPQPVSGRNTFDAVAKDGIQLRVKARVTVRTNIDKLVGGATEETIIARVGEGIVTTIGSAASHKLVLQNPDSISKTVLAKGLDAGTAFEILSIDIADIDVGENIGARLQCDQAEADKRVAQAQAEMRRAAAVALEQENVAKVQEMQAKVIEAQAQIPMALAAALREGNLGIMDYYKLENIKADTQMRSAISTPGES